LRVRREDGDVSADPILDELLADYPPEHRDDPALHAQIRGTVGYQMAALRAEALRQGAGHLVDQIDALGRDIAERRDEFLRRWWIDPR
jgi:hypothetical protein